jgi:hypothetical protein
MGDPTVDKSKSDRVVQEDTGQPALAEGRDLSRKPEPRKRERLS